MGNVLLKDKTVVTTKSSRNYGIDALRILSMFFVVILHILGHGGILSNSEVFTPQYEVAWFLEIGAYCAVNCYALISGYVGINSKYKYSNIAILWLRVFYYSVGITIIFKIFKSDLIGLRTLLSSAMPVLSNSYWYFTAYFAMFMFIPLLNIAMSKLNKKQFTVMISIILFSCFSIFRILLGEVFNLNSGYSTWWLMILYVFGGYIKKYGLFPKIKRNIWFALYFVMIALTWLSKLVLELVTNRLLGTPKYGGILISYISPTIVLSAVCLLMFFKDLEFKSFTNKIIMFLSPLAFSVYLIHDNSLVRANIISIIVLSFAKLPATVLPFAVIGVALGIFAICCVIDLIREQLFKVLKVKQRLNKLEEKYIGDLWKI